MDQDSLLQQLLSDAGIVTPHIIPVLSGQVTNLMSNAPSILVLLTHDQYQNYLFELRLMSINPYPQASLGDQVLFPVGSGDSASLSRNTIASIPGAMTAGTTLVSAMTVNVFAGDLPVDTILNQHTITVSFIISIELIGREFVILYWDETLGDWVELETTVLYWDTRLNSGLGGWLDASLVTDADMAFITEGRAITTTSFTGAFALVVLP